MLLNAKKMAFLGLLLAFNVLMIILSGIFEFNTLFLLAAASFCVGIAIRESGIKLGLAFYIAGLLLGIMLAPDKLYCITYAAMGLYIVVIEFAYDKLAKIKRMNSRFALLWLIKYAVFNIIYIPTLIFSPRLVYSGQLSPAVYAVLILGGQVALYIFDWAYIYFQGSVWGKLRKKLKL